MVRDDDKKKRGDPRPSSYIKYGLAGAVGLYLVFGTSMLGPKGGAGLLPAGLASGLRRAEEQQVPVPKTPRSVIRYYDGNTVVTYDHYQPGQTANWWSVVHHNVWEADTLACIRLFLSKIRPNSVYIDFGAWVGPTALFASSYAKAVYAMEPDPGAYYELYWNVKMNPAIASKAQTAQLCISDSAGVLEMHGELGSSMSTLLEYPGAEDHRKNNNTNYADFKVECMSLQTFLDSRGINIADVGLIKMDTEGGEVKILPQLKPWLAIHKPNILLSLHAFLFKSNTEAHAAIKSVIALYAHPIWLDGRPVDKENINVANDCYLCAMLLTDTPVTQEQIKEAMQAAA